MNNILTKVFKFNEQTKELEKTLLSNAVETWVVKFPHTRDNDGYNDLTRIIPLYQSFTSKKDDQMFYDAVTAAFELTGNDNFKRLVSIYNEKNHTL